MKLCENQKIAIITAFSSIGIVLSMFFFVTRVIETLEIMIALIALNMSITLPLLTYLFPISRRRKKRQLRKLNDEVFKKWKEVIINRDRLQIEYIFKTPIDTDSYEQGKRFLASSKETQDVSTIWSTLDALKAKYNAVGNRIKEPVATTFSGDYPSLKELREFSDSFYGDCFVVSNILKLLDENSLELLNDEIIDWTKLVRGEKYIDTSIPVFRLVNQGVLIQSKHQNDVDIKRFQSVMEQLEPIIITDIKQLATLYGDISRSMEKFKRRIAQLSNDIDTHL